MIGERDAVKRGRLVNGYSGIVVEERHSKADFEGKL